MIITLSQETEAALEAKAAQRGMKLDAFVTQVLDREVVAGQTGEEKETRDMDGFFRQLRQLSSKVSRVPDPHFSRQTIYRDHD